MFVAALLTIAKRWKQPICSCIDEGINKMWSLSIFTKDNYFSLKKEESSDTCYNIDQLRGCYAKWNKPVTKRWILWFYLYEVPRVDKIIKTESRWVVARGWREQRMGSCCLMEMEFGVCKIKRVLGTGCTTKTNVLSTTELHTYKWFRL